MALQWRGDEKAQFNRSNCARFATASSRRVNWTELRSVCVVSQARPFTRRYAGEGSGTLRTPISYHSPRIWGKYFACTSYGAAVVKLVAVNFTRSFLQLG